jgi:hypothetical protein
MPAALTIKAFDPFTWINEYTNPTMPTTAEVLGPILQFSLMWNLFERDTCKRYANLNSIKNSVHDSFVAGLLHGAQFNEHLEYFRSRSTRNGLDVETYISALLLTDGKAKRVVRGVLEGTLTDPKNVVYALLLIAHRIRNNLFHGNKDVAILHSQVDLFKTVNSLLATYLSATKVAEAPHA